ncbi:hypothetical protein CXU17_11040 [Akkermansia muciniphila]|nr:hypothetical protein CXU17_11040 [Akkermansia muciniphila]
MFVFLVVGDMISLLSYSGRFSFLFLHRLFGGEGKQVLHVMEGEAVTQSGRMGFRGVHASSAQFSSTLPLGKILT